MRLRSSRRRGADAYAGQPGLPYLGQQAGGFVVGPADVGQLSGQRRVRSNFDQSCDSIRPQLYSVLSCTLFWPYSNTVYLVLAIAQTKYFVVFFKGN